MCALNIQKTRTCIEKFQNKIFPLVLYATGGDRDSAYAISVKSFIGAFNEASLIDNEKELFLKIVETAVKNSRAAMIVPSRELTLFDEFSPEKRNMLRIVKESLSLLTFNERAFLILRDQIHLLYHDIALIFHISQNTARSQTIHARMQLRANVEKILADEGPVQ